MRATLALFLVVACAAASAGEVYKWRDKDGRLHYGDRPKDAQAESVTVKSSSGSGASYSLPILYGGLVIVKSKTASGSLPSAVRQSAQ